MVVGSGMIAKAYKEYQNNNDVVIFASGVSNSKETIESNFKREEELLKIIIESNKDKIIVYFSTCSIEDNSLKDSMYVKHKRKMELYVEKHCKNYYIFRLPQVVGETNSPTLINFLFNGIMEGKELTINANSTRNIIAVEDVYSITDYLIKNNIYKNEITNIATPFNTPVINIVNIVEKIINKKAKYKLLPIGEKQYINIDKLINVNNTNTIFKDIYLYEILEKYANRRF